MRVVLNELVAVGRIDELHCVAPGVLLDLLEAVCRCQTLFLGFDEGQSQWLLMLANERPQQVVHPAAATLERLAVDDFNAHGALFALNLAMGGALGLSHALHPARLVQRGVDELGAGVGFVETGLFHGGRGAARRAAQQSIKSRVKYRSDILPFTQKPNHVDEVRPVEIEPTDRKIIQGPRSKTVHTHQLPEARRTDAWRALNGLDGLASGLEEALRQWQASLLRVPLGNVDKVDLGLRPEHARLHDARPRATSRSWVQSASAITRGGPDASPASINSRNRVAACDSRSRRTRSRRYSPSSA